MMDMLVNATLPRGYIYGHLCGELVDPLLVKEGRERERENLPEFGVYERVPRPPTSTGAALADFSHTVHWSRNQRLSTCASRCAGVLHSLPRR